MSDSYVVDISEDRLRELGERIHHRFNDLSLLRLALMHRSWMAEQGATTSNERLEFLGDAVLGWVVADLAYHQLSDQPEGKLSDLRQGVVNAQSLAEIARHVGIGEYLLLGRGEDVAGGRDKTSILADAFEAIIGAVYLDGGANAAAEFVRRHLESSIENAIPRLDTLDFKTRLQELVARMGLQSPKYSTIGEGPDHDKVFTAEVRVNKKVLGLGTGHTKKAAEQMAAEAALETLRED